MDRKICRLCLKSDFDSILIEIFKNSEGNVADVSILPDFNDKVKRCLPFKVQACNNLPRHICYRCLSKLDDTHTFIQACIDSNKKLQCHKQQQKIQCEGFSGESSGEEDTMKVVPYGLLPKPSRQIYVEQNWDNTTWRVSQEKSQIKNSAYDLLHSIEESHLSNTPEDDDDVFFSSPEKVECYTEPTEVFMQRRNTSGKLEANTKQIYPSSKPSCAQEKKINMFTHTEDMLWHEVSHQQASPEIFTSFKGKALQTYIRSGKNRSRPIFHSEENAKIQSTDSYLKNIPTLRELKTEPVSPLLNKINLNPGGNFFQQTSKQERRYNNSDNCKENFNLYTPTIESEDFVQPQHKTPMFGDLDVSMNICPKCNLMISPKENPYVHQKNCLKG